MQAISTTAVPCTTWLCPGHSTFLSSAQDSAAKLTSGILDRFRSSGATGRCGWGRALTGWSPRWTRRSARLPGRISAISLPRLPVGGVRAAPAAVLRELDPVGRVPLRFLGLVVAALALGAGERDRNSDSGLGHFSPVRS